LENGYLQSRSQTRRTVENFSRHLNAGGELIIEPWVRKSMWRNFCELGSLSSFEDDVALGGETDFGQKF
jgi:hypothetical protein